MPGCMVLNQQRGVAGTIGFGKKGPLNADMSTQALKVNKKQTKYKMRLGKNKLLGRSLRHTRNCRTGLADPAESQIQDSLERYIGLA